MKKKYVIYFLAAVIAIVSFVVISQVSQLHSDSLKLFIEQAGFWGVFTYISALVASIVLAPLGTGFLLPVAANSFGPFVASVYSIIGWTIGSVIAFYLARRFGLKLVKNVKTVTWLREIEQSIPVRHMFMTVVLLRIALPVDVLSYALGIFGSMSHRSFIASTIIGVSPFTIIFMYAATSTIAVQISVSVFGTLVFLSGIYFVYYHRKKIQCKDTDTDFIAPVPDVK